MRHAPDVTEETTAFQTPWLSVRKAEVVTADGQSSWYFLAHPGCALVLPITRDGKVALIHIWRVAVRQSCWEAPAGRIEAGESPEQAAARELKEETGGTAAAMHSLGTAFSSTGSSNEKVHLFVATGVTFTAPDNTADEVLQLHLFEPSEALDNAITGAIEDATSALAILRAVHRGHLQPVRDTR